MATTTQQTEHVQLALEGMTCASCAARIERRLNKLAGVEATVNYATEQASVNFDADRVAVDDLLRAVEAAGYRAQIAKRALEDDERARRLAARVAFSAALTAPLAGRRA